jgi:D-glycero-alpha-D-manno-heptose-7-phosphate kinase
MLIVRTPVRISFAGGGTDLPAYYERHGGAVLSTTINKYFYTVLRKRADGKVQIISSDLRACETWQDIAKMSFDDSELAIPLAAVKELCCEVSADLFLSSEIPPGTGLGSSAAVCVNVLKTLTTYLHLPYSRYELAEAAYQIARNVLNKPVGKQDEFAAAFGGLNLIRFERDGRVDVEPVHVAPIVLHELQSNLMLFFTGAAHHSWTILQEQEKSSSKPAGVAVDALHHIRSLTERMKGALLQGDLHDFGIALDEGWQAKKLVSDKITNARIDALYDLAKRHGALGGKITGAGGGGFLLLYCEKPQQQHLREAFRREGVREMEFDFDFHGAHVIVNDPFIDGDERCGPRWTFVPNVPGLQSAIL